MFKVTARTILELGSELISSDIIAFYELVKNAFDAGSKTGADIHFRIALRRNAYLRIRDRAVAGVSDEVSQRDRLRLETILLGELIADVSASVELAAGVEVTSGFNSRMASAETLTDFIVKLDDAYRELNTIEVSDTGSGMSMPELTEHFLTIGTPSRKREVDRVIAEGGTKVPYLGEKGIGRLSAMRLGERLRLETARAQDTHLSVLEINWASFADLDAMIDDVPVAPRRGAKKESGSWSGTRLSIGDIVEDWTEKRVRALAEYDFARLVDPFADPKKRPRIGLHWNGTRIAIPWMDSALVKHAHALFRGGYIIGANGEPELRVQMEAMDLGYSHPHEKDKVRLTLPDLEGLLAGTSQELPLPALTTVGPFEFEVYWYNRRHLAAFEHLDLRAVRELQKKWSGILLFRDGFRVFPYGDDEDDWLGLDRRALGKSGYVLNKAQFVGHIRITRAGNPRLVDQTNREGLRSTPEQQVFIAILQHIVRDMLWDFFREVDRQHKRLPLDLGELRAEVNNLEARTKAALVKVRKLVPKEDVAIVDDLQHAFTEFRDVSVKAQARIGEVEADSRQMVQMAGVGLMVEVVAHELARASESALEALEALRGKEMPNDVRSKLETLRSEMKTVSKRLRVLDQLSVSGRQRSEVFDLGELLDDLKDGHDAQFRRHQIVLKIERPVGSLRVRLVKGMVVQILENLISNSVYWMGVRKAREASYKPSIDIRIEMDPPAVYFRDNGRGIARDHREKVFRPFWSLKEKSKRRGLGLYIARENAEYIGGRLSLSERIDRHTDRLHEFVLELPEASIVK